MPVIVVAVPPRDTDVLPIVRLEFASLAFVTEELTMELAVTALAAILAESTDALANLAVVTAPSEILDSTTALAAIFASTTEFTWSIPELIELFGIPVSRATNSQVLPVYSQVLPPEVN